MGNAGLECPYKVWSPTFRGTRNLFRYQTTCNRRVIQGWNSRFCLYHNPKNHHEPRRFWLAFLAYIDNERRRLASLQTTSPRYYFDFRGFKFPGILPDIQGLSFIEFEYPVVFNDALFRSVTFQDVVFRDYVLFERVKFVEGARFQDVRFEGNVFFGGVKGLRHHDIEFVDTAFNRKSEFEDALFWFRALFNNVTFENEAIFRNIRVGRKLDFGGSTFNNKAIFTRFLEASMRKEHQYPNPSPYNGYWCDFEEVKTGINAELTFKSIDLSNWLFANTPELTKAYFFDIGWPDRFGLKRKYVLDEIKAITEKPANAALYKKANEVYRYLRLNYESRLAYDAASDFHIGQMEMLLKNPATRCSKKFFLHLYKWISNFGESIELPLLWFLLLLAVFTAIWVVEPLVAPIEDIFSWRVTAPWELWRFVDTVSAVEVSSYFVKKTLFTLKAFFTFSSDAGIPGQTLAVFQKVLGAGIITLFILALRRAFRR